MPPLAVPPTLRRRREGLQVRFPGGRQPTRSRAGAVRAHPSSGSPRIRSSHPSSPQCVTGAVTRTPRAVGPTTMVGMWLLLVEPSSQ